MKRATSLVSLLGIAAGSFFLAPQAQAQCKLNFDLNQWEEVARDDFSGTSLNTTLWQTKTNSSDPYAGWGCEWYDAPGGVNPLVTVGSHTVNGETVGAAHLTATRMLQNGTPYSITYHPTPTTTREVKYKAGMLLGKGYPNPANTFHQESFGAFEARLRLPANDLAWPAFWLWSCPTEIDILDGVSYNNDPSNVNPGMLTNVIDNRYSATNNPNGNTCGATVQPTPQLQACERRAKLWSPPGQYTANLLSSGYHTYSMVWTPDQVSVFLDGREIRTVPKSAVATIGGYFPDVMLTMQMVPWASDNISVTMDVDYIRMLKPKATGGVRNYAVAASSYKSDYQFMNHDVSVTGVAPHEQPRAGIANVSADAGSIAINDNNPNQVFYRGTDNKMYVSTNNSGTWSVSQLPSVASGDVLGSLAYHPGMNYILYMGADYRIQAYYYASGSWQHLWITSPYASTDLMVMPWSQGVITVRASDNYIIYAGHDHQLHYCYPSGPYWGVVTITNTDGNPAWVDSNVVLEQGTKAIYYRGFDGRLQGYWWNGSAYQHTWVDTNWSTSAYTASSQPQSVTMYSNIIYYIGQADNKIHRFAYNGTTNSWDHTLLPTPAYQYDQTGYYQADRARAGIHCNAAGNRITYLGYDGRIQGLYIDNGTWYHFWLDDYWNTDEFHSFTNASGNAASYASIATTGNLQAFYCGWDQHLRYFVWEPCQSTDDYALCVSSGQSVRTTLHRGVAGPPGAMTGAGAPAAEAKAPAALLQPSVTPNPTTDRVDVYFPGTSTATPFVLYSAVGQLVEQGTLTAAHTSLDLSKYQAGIYLLVVQGDGQTYRSRIIKN